MIYLDLPKISYKVTDRGSRSKVKPLETSIQALVIDCQGDEITQHKRPTNRKLNAADLNDRKTNVSVQTQTTIGDLDLKAVASPSERSKEYCFRINSDLNPKAVHRLLGEL